MILRYIHAILMSLAAVTMMGADLSFSGTDNIISLDADAATGLNRIYVIENTEGVTASFTASSATATVNWYVYGNLGGGYAEQVAVDRTYAITSYKLNADDCGIIIEEGTTRYYFWIVNYANHRLRLNSLTVSDDSDCYNAMLDIVGTGGPITYYAINGVPRELSREMKLTYQTLEYDDDAENYVQVNKVSTLDHISSTITVQQPLIDTRFSLTGDRFISQWRRAEIAETDYYHAIAVEAHTSAVQSQRENDNESHDGTMGFGGSAPVDMTFTAQITDAVRFVEWQFSRDPEFNSYDLTFNQEEVSFTFTDYGTTYVRFQASNNDGSCDYFSEIYEINVGESKLLCPNAFSPGNQDGVNDIWKVSYKSIIDFECHIFNRWGVEVASFTDPSQGWDGRHNGKLVKSGVYFYVITARGADGRNYKLSGDINVLNSTRRATGGGDDDSPASPAE